MKKFAAWLTPESAWAALRMMRRVGVFSISFISSDVSILGAKFDHYHYPETREHPRGLADEEYHGHDEQGASQTPVVRK